MLESLEIKGFKKFTKLQLNGFGNLNFIVGDNNVGKTTILEAIYAWACGFNGDAMFSPLLNINTSTMSLNPYAWAERLGALTNGDDVKDFRFVFSGVSEGEEIAYEHHMMVNGVLLGVENAEQNFMRSSNMQGGASTHAVVVAQCSTTDNKGIRQHYDITIPWSITGARPSQKVASYMGMLAHQDLLEVNKVFTSLKKNGRFAEFLRRFQQAFPEVENVEYIPYPNGTTGPLCIKQVNGKYLPLYSYGDGCQVWFYVIGSTLNASHSILCMDEIDATLHYSLYRDFCTNLMRNAAELGTQIFFTTHNLEFIDEAIAAYTQYSKENANYTLHVLTLKDFDGQVRVRNMDGQLVHEMRRGFQMELR